VADGGSVTLAIEFASPHSLSTALGVVLPTTPCAPADAIPVQPDPSLTISLTAGCETPLDALTAATPEGAVRCHPCDEAVVRLLMGRAGRSDDPLFITSSICPGTLCLG
jgi:hypothetical protein